MRILHVIPGLTHERGGPSCVVRALLEHQGRAGHDVRLLTTDQGARCGEQAVELGVGCRADRLAVHGPDRLAFAPGFRAACRAALRGVDLVHVHSIFTHPVHAALAEAAACGVPVVLRPCGQLHPYSLNRSRWIKRLYLGAWGRLVRRACTAWHFTSEEESARSWPADSSPRFVIPNGVEPSDYAMPREEARRAVETFLPALETAPYVLWLGRLHAKKRVDLLLRAFLAGAPRHFKLVIAGPDTGRLWGGMARTLEREAHTAQRVLRVPTVTGRNKAALLAGATLFAMPSEHENFAASTPVLLSPHVDLAGALHREPFVDVTSLDAGAWAEKLAQRLADPDRLARAGELAKAWVRQRYAWHRVSADLLDRYRWVLSGCRAAA
jgi:glycosyltransferase involved in cell wall biosynthesis